MQLVQSLLNRLPQPLRDRLIAWRVLYPNTPLKDLPPAVQEEVTQILTSTLPQSPSVSAPQPPPADSGLRQPLLPPPVVERLKALQSAYPNTPRPTPARPTPRLATVIGTETATARDIEITQAAKQHGMYLIGENGTSNTNIIKTMVSSDLQAGLGLCVIEPHGDLTNDILGLVPRHRLNDVLYLDVEDYEFPFGINLFEIQEYSTIRIKAAAASFVSHTFETLWQNSGFDTPRLMQNLRAVTRTLFVNPGSTFADIPFLYSSEETRARMLANVTNPHILAFWAEYERMNFRDRRLFTESTLNRVTAFLDEPMILHILAQAKTTIDFRHIMDNSKILLIKLSPQFEEASRLIGTVLIGKLLMTAFSRADTPEERRQPFNLYVDEVQRFQSSDLATLISEARKFRISTSTSNKLLTQLLEQNRASALASGTIICFRVSGDDSRVLARSFDTRPTQPHVVGEEPIRSPVTDVVGHLLRRGHLNPEVAAFSHDVLARLASLETHAARAHGAFEFGCCVLPAGFVELGKHAFNAALYECMASQNPEVVISPLALFIVGGAVDHGITQVFWKHMRFLHHQFDGLDSTANYLGHPNLLTDEKTRAHLMRKYAWRRYWDTLVSYHIVTPAPSFLAFLQTLRQVMAILAREPILVDTGQYRPRLQPRLYSDVEGEISNYLVNQENYHAKVKIVSSGEYTIKTRPAPETLSGAALTERIEAVKRQCRALGYTRHYTEVMEELRKRQEQWRRDTGAVKPQPPDGKARPQEPPPPALF